MTSSSREHTPSKWTGTTTYIACMTYCNWKSTHKPRSFQSRFIHKPRSFQSRFIHRPRSLLCRNFCCLHLRDRVLSRVYLYVKSLVVYNRVTTCLENLEMSVNLTAVREISGILLKIRELSGKKSCQGKLPETVYCKLHICVHTGI